MKKGINKGKSNNYKKKVDEETVNNIKVIGCDIGGVIRNVLENTPIPGAIEAIRRIAEIHQIMFISKCKEHFKERSNDFLKKNNLDNFPVCYCDEYDGKISIAIKYNVSVMIDDKMQVLTTFPENIIKIWICDDENKIEGAKKYQPEYLKQVVHAKNWDDILKYFSLLLP